MKKNNRPRSKRLRNAEAKKGSGPVFFQHPLSALSLQERREAIAELGEEQTATFAELHNRGYPRTYA